MLDEASSTPIEVEKAWFSPAGDVFIEGWVSKPGKDLDRHSAPPECFTAGFDEYFQRCAPISVKDHNMQVLPAGHHQRGALVRDGQIFKEAVHPTDPADFQHPPQSGTGWYGRARLTHATSIDEVRKGNVSAFSWTGVVTDYTTLQDGVLEFKRVYPLRESTITAFPKKSDAIFHVSKSEGVTMDPQMLEAALAKAFEQFSANQARQTADQVASAELTAVKSENAALKEQLSALEATFAEKFKTLEAEVQKAQLPQRGSGEGSKQIVKTDEELRDEDPLTFITSKAVKGAGLEPVEKDFIARLTVHLLSEGMKYTSNGD